jgi:hypothetical protein
LGCYKYPLEPELEPNMFDNHGGYVSVDDEELYMYIPVAYATNNVEPSNKHIFANANYFVDGADEFDVIVAAKSDIPLEVEVNDVDL